MNLNITTSRFIESVLKNKRRILKVLQFGAKTAEESAPFGVDSSPIKNMVAIFANTSNSGKPVILGYINREQLAAAGEVRLFSVQENGDLSTYVWLKNNGQVHLAGDADNIVRYLPLASAIEQTDTSINIELTKIVAAIAALGGTYTMQPINTDISSAKVNEVKTTS